MCEAYVVTIQHLRDTFKSFDKLIQKELSEYVPMGDNYFIGPPGADQCYGENPCELKNECQCTLNDVKPLF